MPPTRETLDQMPGLLRHVDDPWGIGWRATNLVKRLRPARGARMARAFARGVRYERPVFVVGVPRSGTTFLFRVLSASGELNSLPHEGHDLWRTFHHPRYAGWRSDAVGPGEVRPGERRYVNAWLHARLGDGRFVEKTPENVLRVPYILDLFPDARFIAIKRHPPDVVSSLVNGWRHPAGRYRSYYVPETLQIPGHEHRRRWCFALIDGWRALAASPVPEIALAQWAACTRAMVEARRLVPPGQWEEVFFEDLLDEPDATLERVCAAAQIRCDRTVRDALERLIAAPVNALSAPQPDKWRRDNLHEIAPLLPRMAPLAAQIGYDLHASDAGAHAAR